MQNVDRAHGTHSLKMHKRRIEHGRSSEFDASDSYKKFWIVTIPLQMCQWVFWLLAKRWCKRSPAEFLTGENCFGESGFRLLLGWFGWFFGFNQDEFVKTAANGKESAESFSCTWRILHAIITWVSQFFRVCAFPMPHSVRYQIIIIKHTFLNCRTVEICICIFCACKNCRPHKMWSFFYFIFSFSFILLISMDVCIYLHKNSRGKHTKLKLKQHEFKYDENTHTHSHIIRIRWRTSCECATAKNK